MNKVIKMMKINHKRKITEKATPADIHQPSMLNATFLAASYFSTSCHLRKVKIFFFIMSLIKNDHCLFHCWFISFSPLSSVSLYLS